MLARKEANVLFNDSLNTFYGIYGYMVLDIWQRTTEIVRKETCWHH